MRGSLFLVWVFVLSVLVPAVVGGVGDPVVLVYHGRGLELYGEALAGLIESDSRMGGVEVLLVGDQELLATLVLYPNVRCVVLAITNLERDASSVVPSMSLYFEQGGGAVGLGNAGMKSVTGVLAETVFPLYGRANFVAPEPTFICRDLETGERRVVEDPVCGEGEVREIVRRTVYRREEDHPVGDGVSSEFAVDDTGFVTRLTYKAGSALKPRVGEYTLVYKDSLIEAPLIVVYEANGTSVTIAGAARVSVDSENDAFYGDFLGNPDFKTMFQNAVHYTYTHQTRSQELGSSVNQRLEEMELEEEAIQEEIQQVRGRETTSTLTRSTLYIGVGAILIAAITYLAFIQQTERKSEEHPPEEGTGGENPETGDREEKNGRGPGGQSGKGSGGGGFGG